MQMTELPEELCRNTQAIGKGRPDERPFSKDYYPYVGQFDSQNAFLI
jgi:hypothetical protein